MTDLELLYEEVFFEEEFMEVIEESKKEKPTGGGSSNKNKEVEEKFKKVDDMIEKTESKGLTLRQKITIAIVICGVLLYIYKRRKDREKQYWTTYEYESQVSKLERYQRKLKEYKKDMKDVKMDYKTKQKYERDIEAMTRDLKKMRDDAFYDWTREGDTDVYRARKKGVERENRVRDWTDVIHFRYEK